MNTVSSIADGDWLKPISYNFPIWSSCFFLNKFGKFAKICLKVYFLLQVPKTELKMFLI